MALYVGRRGTGLPLRTAKPTHFPHTLTRFAAAASSDRLSTCDCRAASASSKICSDDRGPATALKVLYPREGPASKTVQLSRLNRLSFVSRLAF